MSAIDTTVCETPGHYTGRIYYVDLREPETVRIGTFIASSFLTCEQIGGP